MIPECFKLGNISVIQHLIHFMGNKSVAVVPILYLGIIVPTQACVKFYLRSKFFTPTLKYISKTLTFTFRNKFVQPSIILIDPKILQKKLTSNKPAENIM